MSVGGPKELNRYVKLPELSTIDDIGSKLGKSQVFTVLDAKDGFRQVTEMKIQAS